MDQSDLKGELTISNGDDKARFLDVPRPILEALHATVTGATESLRQRRRLPAIVKLEDLEQLFYQLSQWSEPYDPISRSMSISVYTTDANDDGGRRKTDYTSIEALRRELPGKTDTTSQLIISFDVLANSDKDGRVNKCSLIIELVGQVTRTFYAATSQKPLGGYLHRNSDNWSVSFTVKYTDVIIARSLLSVAEEWYKNLEQMEFPKLGAFRKFLHSAEPYQEFDVLRLSFRFFPFLFGVGSAIFADGYVGKFFADFPEMAYWLLMVLLCSGFYIFTFGLALRKFDALEGTNQVPLLELTSGDSRRVNKFGEKQKRREMKINFWGNTVLVGFSISILANSIFLFLK